MSAAAIRKKAAEVGARVDAMEAARKGGCGEGFGGRAAVEKPDLNEFPVPEDEDEDDEDER